MKRYALSTLTRIKRLYARLLALAQAEEEQRGVKGYGWDVGVNLAWLLVSIFWLLRGEVWYGFAGLALCAWNFWRDLGGVRRLVHKLKARQKTSS